MDSEALLTVPGLPLGRLDSDAIAGALAPTTARLVERLDVFAEIDSTNRFLLEHPPSRGRLAVCLAEYQHAGRGRRGRAWTAPPGTALCLSVGWQFAERPHDLPALTLACGVAARRALETRARVSVRLKWPNDLVWDDRKLGGILVELAPERRRVCHAVVGIGINVALPPDRLRSVSDWPRGAVDLREATHGEPPDRSALAAALVGALAEVLSSYAAIGFAPYRAEFEEADWLHGRAIRVDDAGGELLGVARGIDPDGALRVDVGEAEREAEGEREGEREGEGEGEREGDGRVRRVTSGDVSIRWNRLDA